LELPSNEEEPNNALEEGVRYRPVSVKELLTELHTISTFMVDLAYSAVLFNDRELAQEVVELEEKVDNLRNLLLMNTAIAVRSAKDAEEMMGILRMGTIAARISGAAGDIARIVLHDLGVDPYVVEAFSKVQERLVRTVILPESILVGKSLGRLGLEANIGVDIIVIRRGKELMIKPGPKVILRNGDILIARGSDISVSELEKLAKGELRSVPRPKLDAEGMN